MLLSIPNSHAVMANIDTTRTNMPAPIPLARIAVTSLSAANRLNPIRIPTSTPMGNVTMNVVGSVKRKISPTLGNGALFRTTSSSRRPRSRMKRIKVNSNTPSRACELTSFRM